ncbi:MAG: DUF2141 domain-containing protein [Bacteroidales bacterium]
MIKSYFVFIIITLLSTGIFAQEYTIEVKVNNVRSDKGYISAALYNNAETFPSEDKEDIFMGKKTEANKGNTTIRFENVPAGKYAMAILHDENNNNEMDKNFLGIPQEGYCFSENAKAKLGYPKFEKASFRVKGDNYTTVFMQY